MNPDLEEFSNLPRFADGRINYSTSRKAPVLNCFVKYKDDILILKRSNNVRAYKGKWNSVGGYIDEDKILKHKLLEELYEELNISQRIIKHIKEGESYELEDKDIDKVWIIFPFLVELSEEPVITLDSEHTEFKWIKPDELLNYDIVPDLDLALKKVL